MASNKCACPQCTCDVSKGQTIERNGQLYCGEACASGHPDGKSNEHSQCPCC